MCLIRVFSIRMTLIESLSLASTKLVTVQKMRITVNLTRLVGASNLPRSWYIIEVNSSKETEEVKLDKGKTADEGHPVFGRDHPEVDSLGRNPKT